MLLTSPWPGLGLHWDNGWVLPPGAYTRHARAAAAGAPHAGRLTPASRPPARLPHVLLASWHWPDSELLCLAQMLSHVVAAQKGQPQLLFHSIMYTIQINKQ